VRTPESLVVPVVADWGAGGDAVGECGGCADVVRYDPEALGPGAAVLCRSCGLAALGLAGF
jgi:hypothetical protein